MVGRQPGHEGVLRSFNCRGGQLNGRIVARLGAQGHAVRKMGSLMDPMLPQKKSNPAQHGERLTLLDLIMLEDLQQLQDTLADINRVASIITDPDGNPLTMPSNVFGICSLVRQSQLGASECTALTDTIQASVREHCKPVCRTFHVFGIQKAAVPILVQEHHLANWWISQRCAPSPSRDQLEAYAVRIGVKPRDLLLEFEKLYEGNLENFHKIIEWTDKLTHRIAEMGYQNLSLSRDLSNLHRIEDELEKHRSQMEVLVQKRTEELTSVNTRLQLEVMERDLVEEQTTRKSKLIEAVNQIFKLALDNQSDIELPKTFLKVAQSLTRSDFGLLVERKGQTWHVIAVSQSEKDLSSDNAVDATTGDQFELEGIWQELVEGGDAITISHIDDPSAWQPFPEGYPQIDSLLAVPLQHALKTSGFLALANKKEGYAPIDQSDVETLVQAFIEALTRRRKERIRSDNQMRLHLALESANEGLWDFNPKTEQIYYSARWFAMLGYSAEEFPQTLETWRTLTYPDDLALLEGTFKSLSGGDQEAFSIEIRMLSHTEQWCWLQVRGKSVERDSDGHVNRIVGTLIDISKYKHAEVALQKANDELLRLAVLDDLTQIANRRRFDDRLSQEWRRAQRDNNTLAVVFCDIDFFKNYNDTYGHLKGDDTLYAVAQAINATLKRPMDLVARYGGEEFAMVLPATDIKGALRVAREIKEAVATLAIEHKASSVDPFITLSFGVAVVVPSSDMKPKALIEMADQALYRAKDQGRNQIVTVGKSKDEKAKESEPPSDESS